MIEKHHKRNSLLILFGILLISIVAFSFVLKLEFDFDFEKFFPSNDPSTDFYHDFRETFESDNDFILIGLENDQGVFDKTFLSEIHRLTQDLESIPRVEHVVSITNVKGHKSAPGTGQIYDYPLLRWDQPDKYVRDSMALAHHDLLRGTIVSKDMRYTTLWIQHEQQLSKVKCDTLAMDLEAVLQKYDFDKVHVMGRSVGQKIYVEMMGEEMLIFMTLSFFLVVIFLYYAFRSAWGIYIPIIVMLLAIIWNLATIKILGQKIDSMLTVLPTIIFVVGMSDLVHFITRYLAELRVGHNKIESIRITIKEVGLATLLTSVTTALGFLTLLTSPILPIRNFGMYTSFGVMIAYILAFTVLPAMLILIHQPQVDKLAKRDFWTPILRSIFVFVLKKRKAILWSSLIIFSLSLWAISAIRANNFLLQGLNDSHPLKKEMRFFEKNFAGARPMEVAVMFRPDADPISPKSMQELQRLEDYLRQEYGLNGITSFHSIMRYTDQIFHGNKEGFETSSKRIKKAFKMVRTNPEVINKFYNEEKKMARIYGQTEDLGRQYYKVKNENLDKFISEVLADANFTIELTGTARLIDRGNEVLSSSMLQGLAIAFLMIALLFGFLFRSWSMLIISFIPNILPLVMIGGVMGVSGIEFKVANAIIFTIIFGIAVDDTIHFLSKFKIEINKGRSVIYAIKRTFLSSGKAIVITSLILIAGFLSLILSDFQGTFYVGLLISLALVFAVIADLLLLPILLFYLFRTNKK